MKVSILSSAAVFTATAYGHGLITEPPIRAPGPAMAAACGQATVDAVMLDPSRPLEGLPIGESTDSCKIDLCRGATFEDNKKFVQRYKPGQEVRFKASIPIPHEGPMAVNIIDTKTGNAVSEPLISFDSYADESLKKLPENNTDFKVKIPELADGQCKAPGDCVMQWFWRGTAAQQSYESCVDFVIQPKFSSRIMRRQADAINNLLNVPSTAGFAVGDAISGAISNAASGVNSVIPFAPANAVVDGIAGSADGLVKGVTDAATSVTTVPAIGGQNVGDPTPSDPGAISGGAIGVNANDPSPNAGATLGPGGPPGGNDISGSAGVSASAGAPSAGIGASSPGVGIPPSGPGAIAGSAGNIGDTRLSSNSPGNLGNVASNRAGAPNDGSGAASIGVGASTPGVVPITGGVGLPLTGGSNPGIDPAGNVPIAPVVSSLNVGTPGTPGITGSNLAVSNNAISSVGAGGTGNAPGVAAPGSLSAPGIAAPGVASGLPGVVAAAPTAAGVPGNVAFTAGVTA